MSILLSPKLLLLMSKSTSQLLDKQELTTEENIMLINNIKRIRYDTISKYPLDVVIYMIAKHTAKMIKNKSIVAQRDSGQVESMNNKGRESFAQEYLYDITKIFGISDKHALIRICNAPALYKHHFILLNTANSSTSADNIYHINWQVFDSDTLSAGTVNITPIRNIISMRIFPIKFDFINGNQYYRYYYLLIEELIAQSMLGYGERRYHFALESTYTTYGQGYWEVKAARKNNSYEFNPPVTTLSAITISMSTVNGFTNIPMAFIIGYVDFTNPITILLQAILLPLSQITRVRFYNLEIYHPEDPTNAAFIADLTRLEGWETTTVYIPMDGSTRLVAQLDGTVVPLADRPIGYFGFNFARVSVQFLTVNTVIPMCFTSLKD